MEEIREGKQPDFTPRQMHTRDNYVVPQEGADMEKIKEQVTSLPNYFEPYDTTVTFIDMDTLNREHNKLPHGGFVIRSGLTGEGANKQLMEFRVKLDSNPEFTASIMLCYCRAAWRMYKEGRRGAVTVLDVPPSYLSPMGDSELRNALL
jgi:diaminopimelate dehydrogenase